jgi:hypothetical protein
MRIKEVSMPPLIVWALGVVGAVALARVIAREARRINAVLHPRAPVPGKDEAVRLERDPQTGVYRPK